MTTQVIDGHVMLITQRRDWTKSSADYNDYRRKCAFAKSLSHPAEMNK